MEAGETVWQSEAPTTLLGDPGLVPGTHARQPTPVSRDQCPLVSEGTCMHVVLNR